MVLTCYEISFFIPNNIQKHNQDLTRDLTDFECSLLNPRQIPSWEISDFLYIGIDLKKKAPNDL